MGRQQQQLLSRVAIVEFEKDDSMKNVMEDNAFVCYSEQFLLAQGETHLKDGLQLHNDEANSLGDNLKDECTSLLFFIRLFM